MANVPTRFTIDGSEALEAHLTTTCERVLSGVQSIVPSQTLKALVLGGGYGRGQGGVFKTPSGDRPYNDLEFYVFVRGNILLTERKYRHPLNELGERLSPDAGLHVEFKVYSVEKLRRTAVSMFTYDLASGHRMIHGDENIFKDCSHHLAGDKIPLHEATRLLLNRCSGLLLAKNLLLKTDLTAEDQDFIGRNIAKAQLALGDAVLTAYGKYHWSCTERHHRLGKLIAPESLPWLSEIQKHHADGVKFKLNPRRSTEDRATCESLHSEVSNLGKQLWLWVENKRLGSSYSSPRDYALSERNKCAETPAWRNYLLSLRSFGIRTALAPLAIRYPRERLMNSLSLLLWEKGALNDPSLVGKLQQQLKTNSSDWAGLIRAYQSIWQNFG